MPKDKVLLGASRLSASNGLDNTLVIRMNYEVFIGMTQ